LSIDGGAPEPFEIDVPESVLDDLRERIARTRWSSQPPGIGWEYGADFDYLRELCAHWAGAYDWRQLERALNGLSNWRWQGIHFIWERAPLDQRGVGAPTGLPVLLIHGWPGGPIEFVELIGALVAAGHDVIVPSLPGYGFSDQPSEPLNVAGVAGRLRQLIAALGYERYAVQGGDWGAIIGARIAFDDPDRVAGLHLNAPGVLPIPGDLSAPPLSEAEVAYAEAAQRWRLREGFHMLAQGAAPDALAPGLDDSPAGLAAWLVDKYRRWSDCDGEVERRFSKDDLCDFLTLYWATATIGPSMRLYAAEARDRWRLAAGERIEVPAAVADFPAEIIRPPREWSERVLADLRRWSEFERGGHFAAFEEPELLGGDLIEFLAEL
jgi:pimeloyl-ACP methyl ester carboxylesterase